MSNSPRTPPTVRTFRAPDTRTALRAVKDALGADAVILSINEVPGTMFRRGEVEIVAGVGENEVRSTATLPTPAQTGVTRLAGYGRDARPAAPVAAAPAQAAAPAAPVTPPAPVAVAPCSPARTLPSPLLGGHDPAFVEALAELRMGTDPVQARGGGRRVKAERGFGPDGQALAQHMVDLGMDEQLAEELVREAIQSERAAGPLETSEPGKLRRRRSPRLLPSVLAAKVAAHLSARTHAAAAPWRPASGGRRVMALVGPTGVGKTTTVAKIAARALMEHRLKIALVTLDTYRIGATERVTKYGEIMKVPTFVARDRDELQTVLEKTRDRDLVIIDTAGRSLSEAVAKQAEVLRSVAPIQLHLVLSAASGAREMAAVAARYQPLAPEQVIVTKVDECIGPGAVISATMRIGRPVSCVTDGQSVPEDMHAWRTDEWVNLLVGSWSGTRDNVAQARV
jgi:flagellar biosynthesis protein FlhF